MTQRHLVGTLVALVAVAGGGCRQPSNASHSPSQMVAPSQIPGGGRLETARAPDRSFMAETFVHYAIPTHAGPGPHPAAESDDFQLMQGGSRWLGDGTVEYGITGTEPTGGNTAIVAGEQTWDVFVTIRIFTRNDASTQINPCTGVQNTVRWAPIDGSRGVLGSTSVCRNVATKEIVGFDMTLDSGENWSTDLTAGTFDVENVAAHEWGHVAGLGHGNSPASGCLTMYRLSAEGETQKRTLGLGDKLGMDRLYATGDTTAGPGCGS